MCSNRNLAVRGHNVRGILDHWEMCSNRNDLLPDLVRNAFRVCG